MVGTHHAQRDWLLGVKLLRSFRTRLKKFIVDARRQRSLRNVDDEVRHFGLAGQLAQHLLQLLFHLGQLLLQGFQVRRATLLGLELGAQFTFLALQRFELCALVADEQPPGKDDDQQGKERAETDLGVLRP